jgi:proteasome lid subunit RPN8/RPN11
MIQLNPEHLQTISTHAETTYPEECCGILLGDLASEVKTVVKVITTENVWNAETAADFPGNEQYHNKRTRYAIAPQVMLQVQKQARDCKLNIIGIYHSHTDHPAIPSECDRQLAWQEYSYIIVSVQNGKASDIKSWVLDDNHQFQQEAIEKLS